jgi:hypothetical protein
MFPLGAVSRRFNVTYKDHQDPVQCSCKVLQTPDMTCDSFDSRYGLTFRPVYVITQLLQQFGYL